MKKLLLFDLDDTLLRSDHTVSEFTIDVIRRCKARGADIGYITGRAPRRLNEYIGMLPCDALACYNGARISVRGELVCRNEIPFVRGMELIRSVIRQKPQYQLQAVFEPFSYKKGNVLNYETGALYPCGLDEFEETPFQRIVFRHDAPILPGALDGIDARGLNVFHTVDGEVMVTAQTATKGFAVREITRRLSYLPEDIVAFGDDVTDIAMFEAVGTGVAMANAIDALKEKADAVTSSNDDDGVAMWISKNLLMGK